MKRYVNRETGERRSIEIVKIEDRYRVIAGYDREKSLEAKEHFYPWRSLFEDAYQEACRVSQEFVEQGFRKECDSFYDPD